jgi:hypothetical protein
MKVKVSREYVLRFQRMAFGGEPDGETLAVESFYDQNGNLIEQIKNEVEGINEKNYFEYDKDGRIIKHIMQLPNEEVEETMIYERDDKGRVVCETKLYGDDPGERIVNSYQEHESPVHIERYDADGELETTEDLSFNANGFPVTHKKMDPAGKVMERSEVSYNENNKPVERNVYDGNDKLIKNIVLRYNEKGLLSRVTETNGEGKVTSDITTSYDERDNVIERRIRDFHSRTLRFTFDDRNNCIVEEMLDENGNLTMKSEFEFDENNLLISESGFYTDMNRSTSMANTHSRYEYEFYS